MTALNVSTSPVASLRADTIVIGAARGPKGLVLAPGSEEVAEAFGGSLAESLEIVGMTGAEGETVRLPSPAGVRASVVLAVGLGDARDGAYDLEALRRAADGAAARTLAGTGTAALALWGSVAEGVEAVALGGLLGAYSFTGVPHRRRAAARRRAGRPHRPRGSRVGRRPGVRTVIAEEMNRCRDLVNTPANDLTPASFADAVRAAGAEHGLGVEVLDEKALSASSFGGILGVGQGSANPPRLVRVAHPHPGATTTLAFVGRRHHVRLGRHLAETGRLSTRS